MKWTGNKQGQLSVQSVNGEYNTSNYQIDACFTWLLAKKAVLTHITSAREAILCAQDVTYVGSS
ncbi:hypothetical protein H5410_055571 [Solanum commersonii]|uniref:Uncharacterized protein n=1 Tax=Solanum commersonii TaxID=4109 RepID=A0A9J5WJ38_SOLCO|nr:hypothetical protein H5410_055571 [Solanum commersonii]